MWQLISGFIIRKRWWIIFFLIFTTIFSIYNSTKVSIAYDFAKVIPKDDSDYVDYINFKSRFGEDGNILVFGITSPNIFQKNFFNSYSQLCDSISKNSAVEKLLSITKLYIIERNDSDSKFLLKSVTKGLIESQNQMDSIAEIILNLQFYRGILLDDSGTTALAAITLKKNVLDSKERIQVVEELERTAKQFGQKNNCHVYFSGLPYIRTVYATKVKRELELFTLLSIIITAVIMWFFFRSFTAVILSLSVVILGVIVTVGSIGFLGYKITVLMGLVPPLIVIIGIQNCIYLLNVYHSEYKTHKNKILGLSRITSKNGLALFLTNITTAVGFGVFNFTGSSLLDEFSIISAIDIMLVYIISALFIPVIYTFIKPPTSKQLKHLENYYLSGFMEWCKNRVFSQRKWIYTFTGVLTLLGIVGLTQIQSVGFILDDVPEKEKVYTDLKYIESKFHGVMPFEIEIESRKKGLFRRSLDALQKIDQAQKVISQYPEFTKPISLVEMVKFSSQAFHKYRPETYTLPGQDEFLALQGYMKKQQNSTQELMKSLVNSNWKFARISVQMADIGSVKTRQLKNEIKERLDSIFPIDDYTVRLTGTSLIYLKGNEYLIENLTGSLVLALLLNSILMAFLFLSWRMILISLIPNFIPLFITLGIMGYTGVHLKSSTIIIFSITYGISIDFTIHFLAKYRYYLKKNQWNISAAVKDSIIESGVSIVYTSIILFCGFIIFAFSSFGGTVALGTLTSITLILGMFMNLLLLPALLLSFEKYINIRKELSQQLIEFDGE